ncbi:MAG: hypothetical protein ACYCZF_07760 [Anaerolineae bacterium]
MCNNAVRNYLKCAGVVPIVVLLLSLIALNACIPGPGGSVIGSATRTTMAKTAMASRASRTLAPTSAGATKPKATAVPSPTVLQPPLLTFKKAFAFLIKESGVADLALYSYDAADVDDQGQSADYTIAGYSAAQKRFCYHYTPTKGELKLTCRDQETIDDPIVDDLDTLKDSPELVKEAVAKYTTCPSGLHLAINLTQGVAQLTCFKAKWSCEISPYK